MPLKEEPSALASAGPLECASTPPAHSLNSQSRTVDQTISALAELFPSAFTAEKWKRHRPLKRGIHRDLIDCGVLLPDECRIVLRRYCSRPMYRRAVAAGGPRFDLDGHAAGEVASDEADHAKAAVAAIELARARKANAAQERKSARKAARAPVPPKVSREVQPATSAPPAKPARLGLVALKAAARARREAAHG